MSQSHLTLVAGTESPGKRAILLMAEAKAAGQEQVTLLLQTLEALVRQTTEIVDGGEVYPAGVRDACEKLAEHTASRAQSICAIMRSTTQTRSDIHLPERQVSDDIPLESGLA